MAKKPKQQNNEKDVKEAPRDGGEIVVNDPVTGRFVPGHPKLGGKVLGSKNTMTITNEVIEAVAKKSNITPEEAELVLWKKAYNEALNGDFQYHKDWMDRRHGKATEKVEVSGAGEIVHYHIPVRQEPGKWSGDRIQGKN